VIQLPDFLKKETSFSLRIEYSAIPQRGFHFIIPNTSNGDSKDKQAWTQGQMIESKFWFPCIDDPQIKYPREVSVIVPKDFIVVSNGQPDYAIDTNNDNKIHIWKEDHPNPAYLTSIVIGKFFEYEEQYVREISEPYPRKVKLSYYLPEDKKERAKRTFGHTLDMMKFFESYFGIPYPYEKYAQTTVKDFEYGGMENTSCTTLQEEFLLDEKAAIDDTYINLYNSSRSVIAHELAHQWFGDLVTCMDWPDIWLNEGFATYCEALYIEHIHSDRKEEFHRYMNSLARAYFIEDCNYYRRSIVMNRYKYPDELFDSHSYKKGAWIIHMIRHLIEENNFKESLNKYLETYQYKNVKTEDFRKILEEVSGDNLEPFFNQWVYTPGHPELEMTFYNNTKSIKLTQKQDKVFDFKIEIKVALSDSSIAKTYPFHVKEKENIFEITKIDKNATERDIKWISIDPELKVLKQIKFLYKLEQLPMVFNQIRNGQTIVERQQGIQAIAMNMISKENYEEIIDLLKDVVLHDDFYDVSASAASKLGAIGRLEHIDKEIKKKAFQRIKECLNESKSLKRMGRTVVRRDLINSISNYVPDNDFFNELKDIIENDDERSYYVEGAAILAIGKYKNKAVFEILKKAVDRTDTFNDIIPEYAVSAFEKFKDSDETSIKQSVIDILIQKASYENSNGVRATATSALGEFLLGEDKKTVNRDVFMTLMRSLDDKDQRVRKAACAVFETAFSPDEHDIDRQNLNQLFDKLEQMSNNDLFYEVRRNAQLCLFAIRARHYSKMRKIMKNEREFNDYVMSKKQTRIKHVFGSKALQ